MTRDGVRSALFGGRAQVVVGVACFAVGAAAWAYWSWITPPTVGSVFHVSMFYGQAACYAIIATGLNLRATERVEKHVTSTRAT